MSRRLLALALPALLTWSGAAAAADCVAIDEEMDTLTAEERRAAVILFRQALEDRGRTVGGEGCDLTWTVSHVRLGNATTVRVAGKGRPVSLAASSLDEVPATYKRLIDAALSGRSPEEVAQRDTVTDAEANPNREASDNLATLFVGGGAGMAGGSVMGGISLASGFRAELDKLAIDATGRLLFPTSQGVEGGSAGLYFNARLAVLAFTNTTAKTTAYFGGGPGFGAAAAEGAGGGYGLNLDAVGGVAFLRTSRIRMYTQADLSFPTWTTGAGDWLPWGTLSVGIGSEPSNRGLLR